MIRTSYVGRVKDDVAAWLETVRYTGEGWGRWPYNRAMTRPYALESSTMAIEVLELCGLLAEVASDRRAEAVTFLQGLQNSTDGFFKDPFLSEADRVGDVHTWEHNWAHMSQAATVALASLGANPRHPQKAPPFTDLRSVDPRAWVLGLDWRNPWLEAEHVTRAVKWYWNSLPPETRQPADPVVKSLLGTLEQDIFDPATGLPTKRGCKSKAVAMAGLFKAARAYLAVGVEIPFAERGLDSTLLLQLENGSFGDAYVQDRMTMNWDALWVLKILSEQLGHGYRFDAVRAAGERTAELLLKDYRKPGGGFSFHPDHCQVEHNSFYISAAEPIGDMEGTLMSLRCLSYVDEWSAVR